MNVHRKVKRWSRGISRNEKYEYMWSFVVYLKNSLAWHARCVPDFNTSFYRMRYVTVKKFGANSRTSDFLSRYFSRVPISSILNGLDRYQIDSSFILLKYPQWLLNKEKELSAHCSEKSLYLCAFILWREAKVAVKSSWSNDTVNNHARHTSCFFSC